MEKLFNKHLYYGVVFEFNQPHMEIEIWPAIEIKNYEELAKVGPKAFFKHIKQTNKEFLNSFTSVYDKQTLQEANITFRPIVISNEVKANCLAHEFQEPIQVQAEVFVFDPNKCITNIADSRVFEDQSINYQTLSESNKKRLSFNWTNGTGDHAAFKVDKNELDYTFNGLDLTPAIEKLSLEKLEALYAKKENAKIKKI